MKAQALTGNIFSIHADIKNADFFEGIWPINNGVSLNSYLVKGEKTAFIDLFKDWNGSLGQMEEALGSINSGFSEIDYLILNHLEPDHTGWLAEFRRKNPGAQIISTQKGINLVKSFYGITEGTRAVKDGETLDLGNGAVLTFYETPNLHWPETMVTWDAASGTLFSCDAFGSYGALGEKVFDDQCSEEEHGFFENETLRYYSNIISSFSVFVERAIAKITEACPGIKCVAPSHGLIWRTNPQTIIDRYVKYADYAKGNAEPEIAVIWGSMYGNTKAGLDAVLRGISAEGVPYTTHRVPDENVSGILADAYKCGGLVLAMPTYEYAMFPPMALVLDIFRRKHIYEKKVLRIGSYGWSGGAKKEYEAGIANLKWSSLESVEWAGYPGGQDLELLEERGKELAKQVKK